MDILDRILDLENILSDPKLEKYWRKIYQQELENLIYKQQYDEDLENHLRREDDE